MKQWVIKLLQQLDMSFSDSSFKVDSAPTKKMPIINEDKATLIYLMDLYNKHLFEVEKHSIRKVRDKLDHMAKQLVATEGDPAQAEKVLSEVRQFFSSYRIDECSYVQNSFDDFKRIVWDLAEQFSDEFQTDSQKDKNLNEHLQGLKEAVESNSLETLRVKSREFINKYIEHQQVKNDRRQKRISNVKKNLDTVKKQLLEANSSLNVDHLTSAFNRKCFDEQIKKYVQLNNLNTADVTLIILDIDYFKKINDTYGHDIGDFILVECVRIMKSIFYHEGEIVSRIGGEEFAVILPQHSLDDAMARADELQRRIRSEAFVQGNLKIRFTVSMGIAQLFEKESASDWVKRADTALYQSKNSGRNQYTVSKDKVKESQVA